MKKEIRKNLNYYNKNAKAWANRGNTFSLERQFIKFTKHFKKGAKIIDIGCAAGFHVPLFIGLGKKLRYEGFDFSKQLIALARKRFPKFKFYVANLVDKKNLPVKRYDGFWASAVLMHIPEEEWLLMLNNISRMCKSKATGFILIPKKRPKILTIRKDRFFTYWDKNKLKKFLDKVNWKIIDSQYVYDNKVGDWYWYLVKLP